MMDECPPNYDGGSVATRYVEQSACILTYDGSRVDCALNYTVLAIDLLICAFFLNTQAHIRNDDVESNRRTIAALISLGLVLLFQIGLCLALFCSGISIVWCACFGWFLKKSSLKSTGFANDTTAAEDPLSNHSSTVTPQQQEQHDVLYEEYTSPPNNMERAPNQLLCGDICMGLLNVGLICYYALTAESITTIAHLCAVLLGMLLALLEDYVTCPCCVSCCCPFLEIPIAGITRENGTVNISSSDDPLLSSTEAVPAYGRPDLTSTGDVFAPPTESLGMNRPAVRGSFNTSWLKNSFFRSANFQDDFDLSTGVDEERK